MPPSDDQPRLTLQRLKWGFLLTLVILFVFVEYARYNLAPFLDTWKGRVIMDLVILVGSLFFFGFVFDMFFRLRERLERQKRELLALHHAALDIYGDLSLDTVLQKVVDQASLLLDARFGAVAVTDEAGQIQEFITSGVTPEERARIGSPPTGKGLLRIPLHDGQRLRLTDATRDPRAAGVPPHHPQMKSLLAVPITCESPFRGNLYLTEKVDADEFSAEDEETLVRFATAAAAAVDIAYLHQQLRSLAVAEERVRIAREMHDGMAQVLAYVNTKAQAVKQYLDRGKTAEAGAQLEQLASAAREVYTDVREGISALRTELGPDRPFGVALREYVARWESQSGIDGLLEVEEPVELPAPVELQLLRIIQEALSNVRKHSGSKQVRVSMKTENGTLVARVEDDGVGFDPRARERSDFPRFGLAIMRERAESIRGRLEMDSAPGRGTSVKIEVPVSPDAW